MFVLKKRSNGLEKAVLFKLRDSQPRANLLPTLLPPPGMGAAEHIDWDALD